MFSIADNLIQVEKLKKDLENSKAGALVVFEGLVRDINEGHKVLSLEYEVFRELAEKEAARILQEAKARFKILDINCVHREGHLHIGEIAVWIGVTSSHREDAFKACRYIIDEIKLRLPIWKKEHYASRPAEWVDCQGCYHHSHIHFVESDYYSKQKILPHVGDLGQQKLKNSRVLVVGAGGLGSPVLTYLALAGVGHITICDYDKLEVSNLHRQTLYTYHDIGLFKADLAKVRILNSNPFINVEAKILKIDQSNAEELVRSHDVVVDCTDNFKAKFLLHDVCYFTGMSLVQASIYQQEGQLQVFIPDEASAVACLRCTWPLQPEPSCVGSCVDVGVFGAVAGVVGSMQALEVIELLLGRKTDAQSKTILINLPNLDVIKINRKKNVKCDLCGTHSAARDIHDFKYDQPFYDFEVESSWPSREYSWVDVRSNLDPEFYLHFDNQKKYLLVCTQGVRSQKLTAELRARGLGHFYSLKGGLRSLGVGALAELQWGHEI